MNGSFSTTYPTLQVHWDSTSLGTFKSCPRAYQYSLVLGYAPKGEAFHLEFGIAYHGALEHYDRMRALGHPHTESQREATHWAMVNTWNAELQRPSFQGSTAKNRLTLIRSVVWYLEQFAEDPLETIVLADGKPAVELSFRFNTSYTSPDGQPYSLCGHLDRVATLNGEPWVADRKTTGHSLDQRYFERYSPDNQMSLYAFAGQLVLGTPTKGVLVDAAQIAVGFTRFARQPVHRTPSQLDEWYGDLGRWLRLAENFASEGHWPMNEKSCFGCAFRPVCSQPPSSRHEWLEASYVKRIWDPTIPRG